MYQLLDIYNLGSQVEVYMAACDLVRHRILCRILISISNFLLRMEMKNWIMLNTKKHFIDEVLCKQET